ncbi:transcriptional regulator [Sporosarcina ureae]|uniref:autorepressor SdpR family transcription factor n=1 Tax=Sporosarcina ureae TaxID=1571 RepID=UPI000A16C3B1|nr:autorepressor SdpR family transcription factor [Sporosarcina ureae]ARJ39337.1 transcriptional regulator [Sporosarcina ureae]
MNELFKALSDSTRRDILNLLKGKDLTAGEISENFRMSKPSISHHLNVLKSVGLITQERKGQFLFYSLNTTVFQDVMNWMLSFKINK